MLDLNATGDLELYVDGADEATRSLHLIKGGGAALTREKIVAAASRRFVCIVDDQKLVDRLGRFPLPVEVIPMARAYVARQIARLGGAAGLARERRSPTTATTSSTSAASTSSTRWRSNHELNQVPGIVTVGLFAIRPADLLLVGTASGVVTLTRGS